jgi:hypothetical protein
MLVGGSSPPARAKGDIMKFLCKLLDHKLYNIDVTEKTAHCRRCGKKFRVTYDMAYGNTIIVHEL